MHIRGFVSSDEQWKVVKMDRLIRCLKFSLEDDLDYIVNFVHLFVFINQSDGREKGKESY